METDNTKQAIANYVAIKRQQAEQQGASHEEIEKSMETWNNEATTWARQQLYEQYVDQVKADYKEDFDEADRSAAWGYMTDATLEQVRMSATNAAFRKYLFSKGTNQALSNVNPYLKRTTETSTGA